MTSKGKRLTQAAIDVFEATGYIGEELLQSIREMEAGNGKVVA